MSDIAARRVIAVGSGVGGGKSTLVQALAATEKVAGINAAWDRIKRERGL